MQVGSKSVKQCIQFYYMWKKVCPDEYRRLRLIRRRREQESIYYNLRSKEEDTNGDQLPLIKEESDKSGKSFDDLDAENNNSEGAQLGQSGHSSDYDDNLSALMDSANPSPATSVGSAAPVIEYPCKLCGKVC